MRRVRTILAAVLLCACSATVDAGPENPPPNDAGCTNCAGTCPAGLVPIEDGAGCVPLVASETCAPGTRLSVGDATCVPVGVTTCATGFQRAPSGWGCDPILPEAACTGATRERLGDAACVPVGDCNAPFPPPTATHVVDAALPDAALDATHFRTLADALAVAPENAVVAVAKGTYAESIVAKKKGQTITGVCAEKTVFVGNGGPNAGIFVNALADVVVANVTVRGFAGAVAVYDATATLDRVVVDANTVTGIIVSNPGSKLRVVGSVVRGTRAAGSESTLYGVGAQRGAVLEIVDSVIADNEMINAGAFQQHAQLSITRSVLRDGLARSSGKNAGKLGTGVYVSDSGETTITESAILNHESSGVTATLGGGAPSKATVARSTIRGVRRKTLEDFARAVEINGQGVTASVEETTISGSDEYEIIVTKEASLDLRNVTTRGDIEGSPSPRAGIGLVVTDKAHGKVTSSAFVAPQLTGVQAQLEGVLEIDGAVVRDVVPGVMTAKNFGALGFGVVVRTGATAVLGKTWVDRASAVGVLMGGAPTVTLSEAIVTNTQAFDRQAGRGVSIEEGSRFTMSRSVVMNNAECGIASLEAERVTVTDSLIDTTHLDGNARYGIGALITYGSVATFDRTTIRGSEGIGLAVAEASAVFRGGVIARNAVAVHAQDLVSLVERATDGDAPPNTVVISPDTRFVANTTRIGSGAVPLPDTTFGPQK